jgi:hypothetical protein
MLAVVKNEQKTLHAEKVMEQDADGCIGDLMQTEHRCNDLGNERGIGERSEINEPNAVLVETIRRIVSPCQIRRDL